MKLHKQTSIALITTLVGLSCFGIAQSYGTTDQKTLITKKSPFSHQQFQLQMQMQQKLSLTASLDKKRNEQNKIQDALSTIERQKHKPAYLKNKKQTAAELDKQSEKLITRQKVLDKEITETIQLLRKTK